MLTLLLNTTAHFIAIGSGSLQVKMISFLLYEMFRNRDLVTYYGGTALYMLLNTGIYRN